MYIKVISVQFLSSPERKEKYYCSVSGAFSITSQTLDRVTCCWCLEENGRDKAKLKRH